MNSGKDEMSFREKLRYYIGVLSAMAPAPRSVSPKNYARFEKKVREYTLPDPLQFENGERVNDSKEWESSRRKEILTLFREHVYGKAPKEKMNGRGFTIQDEDYANLDGLATKKEVSIPLVSTQDSPLMHLVVYIPNAYIKQNEAAPLFLGLNFRGNHSISKRKDIIIPDSYTRWSNEPEKERKKLEHERGSRASKWPIKFIIEQGFAVATACYHDIVPDRPDGIPLGIHPYFYKEDQEKPAEDEWGAIGAWAWGLSKALDYFQEDKDVDAHRVIVFGHSRLGKTALWAAANDPRFCGVISNNSGCGGAALFRRKVGETIRLINEGFPHWFCRNFRRYNDNEDALPVDQHMLLGLIAPRPLYVASASQDLWADPIGEFLSSVHASPVFELLGVQGLVEKKFPELNVPIKIGNIGYHLRRGRHDITLFDWKHYVDFFRNRCVDK
ncbi:MAG: glucuronyl esterase domain-containing protein [Promethearchaeota archaeon]